VTALVASGGLGGDPQILVGALPGWVENRVIIPANARVLGAAFIGTTVVAVLRSSDSPEGVVATLKRELPSRGWKAPPPQPSYGGGFRPAAMAPTSPDAATRVTFCGDQQVLTVSAARHQGVNTDVTMRLTPAANYSVCTPQPMPAGMIRPLYPTLFNPANAGEGRGLIGDCVMSMASTGTNTTLRTAMEPTALLEHYARQLQDSGWSAAPTGGSIVGRTWTRTDSAGNPLELSITVATSPRDVACRDLNLQVRTVRKP
jgi:hypothetical protein